MHRQVGDLRIDEAGLAWSGLLVRHLVIPVLPAETRGVLDFLPKVQHVIQDLRFDPQTSGSLLIAVAQDEAAERLQQLLDRGIAEAARVGVVVTHNAPDLALLAT